jgi:adenosylmethionine-8-amino-7-oxononanoate aminotransferase
METGLIFRPNLARIMLAPALTATRDDIDEIVRRLKLALDRTAEALNMA